MSTLLHPAGLRTDVGGPRLRARTVALPDPGPLLALLPSTGGFAWIQGGDGMVAWGETARHTGAGPADADAWWRTAVARSEVSSDADILAPGGGLVAFGSFTFDPDRTAASSSLIVPRTVVGRRDGRAWLTQIDLEHEETRPSLATVTVPRQPGAVHLEGGSLTARQWQAAVCRAVDEIHRGPLEKVVLARDLVAVADADLDLRWIASRLAESYPQCWTYLLDGLVGSTPEMLVRLEAGSITSRVLAGTVARTGRSGTDRRLAGGLLRSGKDLQEHMYAVASVAAALEPLCTSLTVPEHPRVLELPNVLHLASDLSATTRCGATSLGLVGALHPSAAVCGVPTALARGVIAELEDLDRDRYAGPVGWTDAHGEGEWAIALRGGIVDNTDPRRIRLFAGCGIVAGSTPEKEWDESQAKLAPMLGVLDVREVPDSDRASEPALPARRTESELSALVARLVRAFNDADPVAFASCFTRDAVWVNIYGDHMIGRDGIERGHREAFGSRLADAFLLPGDVRTTRVSDDVRHVHQRWTLQFPTPFNEGRVASRSGTMVLLGRRDLDGSWAFAGGTNVADQPRS